MRKKVRTCPFYVGGIPVYSSQLRSTVLISIKRPVVSNHYWTKRRICDGRMGLSCQCCWRHISKYHIATLGLSTESQGSSDQHKALCGSNDEVFQSEVNLLVLVSKRAISQVYNRNFPPPCVLIYSLRSTSYGQIQTQLHHCGYHGLGA
jgi:hypothetical protein